MEDAEFVTAEIAAAFVRVESLGTAAHPSVPLLHLRRSALRLLFRSLREAGMTVGDPTLDLVLPPRSPLATRPLADDEVVLCRGHALWSLSDLRRASAWALAEATCRSSGDRVRSASRISTLTAGRGLDSRRSDDGAALGVT